MSDNLIWQWSLGFVKFSVIDVYENKKKKKKLEAIKLIRRSAAREGPPGIFYLFALDCDACYYVPMAAHSYTSHGKELI